MHTGEKPEVFQVERRTLAEDLLTVNAFTDLCLASFMGKIGKNAKAHCRKARFRFYGLGETSES